MEGCVFCRMVAGEIPVAKVYEDEVVFVFLDIGPISDGHTLVIPRQHCTRIHECASDVVADVASRLGKITEAVMVAVGADGYNVLSNNGAAAGQVVEHLHFHVIPRRTGDGVFTEWPSYRYKPGVIEKLATKIREHLK